MTDKERRDGCVCLSPGSQTSPRIDNIPLANSANEPPTMLEYGISLSVSATAGAPSQQPDVQLGAEEEQAAQRRSEATKRHMVEQQFAELFWPVEWVLLWIAFRDPVRFDDDFLLAIFGAKTYSKVPLYDNNPRRTLLRALQSGNLPAVKNGAKLPPEAWATASERRWSADVRFRREDVLKQWPAPEGDIVTEYAQPRPTCVKLHGEALDQAIRNAIKETIEGQTAAGGKKLNGKQQVTAAMKILRLQGVEASALKASVEKIADAEFKQYRNPIGVTLKSQRTKY
jgi:hypothetical protein